MVKISGHEITSLAAKKLLSKFNKHIKAEKMTSKLWSMDKSQLEEALNKTRAYIRKNAFGKWEIQIGTGTAAKFMREEFDESGFTAKHRKFLKEKEGKDKQDKITMKSLVAKLKTEHDKNHKGRAFRLTTEEMKYLYKHRGVGDDKISITNLREQDKFNEGFFKRMKPQQHKRYYEDMLKHKAKMIMKEDSKKSKKTTKKTSKKKTNSKKPTPKPAPKNVKIKKKKLKNFP